MAIDDFVPLATHTIKCYIVIKKYTFELFCQVTCDSIVTDNLYGIGGLSHCSAAYPWSCILHELWVINIGTRLSIFIRVRRVNE